jgi:hypothetical protein
MRITRYEREVNHPFTAQRTPLRDVTTAARESSIKRSLLMPGVGDICGLSGYEGEGAYRIVGNPPRAPDRDSWLIIGTRIAIMTETTWDTDVKSPAIEWRMSAALENVARGENDVAEVTSLAGAVREWQQLDPVHQSAAVLTPERPILIDGVSLDSFVGEAIIALVERFPPEA